MGAALVTSWLQFFYEELVTQGAVLVPQWWSSLHLISLFALLGLTILLFKRDRRLFIMSWSSLVVSLMTSVIPSYA